MRLHPARSLEMNRDVQPRQHGPILRRGHQQIICRDTSLQARPEHCRRPPGLGQNVSRFPFLKSRCYRHVAKSIQPCCRRSFSAKRKIIL